MSMLDRHSYNSYNSVAGLIQSLRTVMAALFVTVLTLGACTDNKESKVKTDTDVAIKEASSEGLDGGVATKVAVTPPALEMEVTVAELKSALEKGENIFLLDVRSEAEFNAGHVAQADTVIPHTKFVGEGVKMPVDKDQYIYVICRSGRRSGIALKWLRENGYNHSYNVIGGMLAWADSGYPVAGAGSER